jgi:hypothetical protein
MKRSVTVVALLLLACASLWVGPEQASAGSSTDAALALGAFAVFNQIVAGQTIFQQGLGPRYVSRETVIVQQPPTVVYQQPPAVVYAPPPAVVYAPPPPVVVYPNGYAYGPPRYYYRPHWRPHYEDD